MLFPALAREHGQWGRTLQRSDVEGCLLKAAAVGHWVAALDACATIKQQAAASGAENGASGANTTATSLDCCVDSKGRSAVGVAADHDQWFTAWVLAEKAKMNIVHRDDEVVMSAVQRGAELAAQVQAAHAKADERVQQAAKNSGPQVIHVDDDLPQSDDEHCADFETAEKTEMWTFLEDEKFQNTKAMRRKTTCKKVNRGKDFRLFISSDESETEEFEKLRRTRPMKAKKKKKKSSEGRSWPKSSLHGKDALSS